MNKLLATTLVLSVIAFPALAVTSISVNDQGLLQGNGGRVIVSGTVSCTPGQFVTLNADLIQGSKKQGVANGGGFFNFTCAASGTQTYNIPVNAQTNVPYRRGPAAVSVGAFFCDEFGCTDTRVNKEIELVNRF